MLITFCEGWFITRWWKDKKKLIAFRGEAASSNRRRSVTKFACISAWNIPGKISNKDVTSLEFAKALKPCFQMLQFSKVLSCRLPTAIADIQDVRFPDSSLSALFTNDGLDYLRPFGVMHRDNEVMTYLYRLTCLVTQSFIWKMQKTCQSTSASQQSNDLSQDTACHQF